MQDNRTVQIVEVGPRDGYQGIGPFIPTSLMGRATARVDQRGACRQMHLTGAEDRHRPPRR